MDQIPLLVCLHCIYLRTVVLFVLTFLVCKIDATLEERKTIMFVLLYKIGMRHFRVHQFQHVLCKLYIYYINIWKFTFTIS